MTQKEQVEFVFDMSGCIQDEVIRLIHSGRVPDDFDGHELRVLLSDKFKDAARMSLLRQHPHGSRNKSYKNWAATTPGV